MDLNGLLKSCVNSQQIILEILKYLVLKYEFSISSLAGLIKNQ